jgi:hypothetical protein
LENARADERERQRNHRAGKGEKNGADPPLSLTGLSVQLLAAVEEIVEELGQAQRLSLTGLRRQARRIAWKTLSKIELDAENLGHDQPLSLTGLDA